MTRILRCTVQYDGTLFAGFQRQAGSLTVQGALEAAVLRVTGEAATVFGAGRTDAGVHALGQVVHFCTPSGLEDGALFRALNAVLPAGVAISDLAVADPDFHARYSAQSREYRYVVENANVASPLWRQRAYHVPQTLSIEAMDAAAAALGGRHDFAAFGSPMEHSTRATSGAVEAIWRGGTERTMLGARCWRRQRFVLFGFVADAFLRHMVRILVGTLLRVGTGKLRHDVIGRLLGGDRSISAGPAVPAHGLYLMRVQY